MKNGIKKVIWVIETTNTAIGSWGGWIILLISFLIVVDVTMRYLKVVSGSAWISGFCSYAFGIVILLGGGYVQLRKAHIKTDVISSHYKARTQAIVDASLFVFFVVFIAALLYTGWSEFWVALTKDRRLAGLAGWPLWPYLLSIPIGALALLLQGIIEFKNNLMALRKPR